MNVAIEFQAIAFSTALWKIHENPFPLMFMAVNDANSHTKTNSTACIMGHQTRAHAHSAEPLKIQRTEAEQLILKPWEPK